MDTAQKAKLEQEASWIAARLKEPSTYAGIAAVTAALGMSLPPGIIQNVTLIGTGIGGLLAFFLPEAKKS